MYAGHCMKSKKNYERQYLIRCWRIIIGLNCPFQILIYLFISAFEHWYKISQIQSYGNGLYKLICYFFAYVDFCILENASNVRLLFYFIVFFGFCLVNLSMHCYDSSFIFLITSVKHERLHNFYKCVQIFHTISDS